MVGLASGPKGEALSSNALTAPRNHAAMVGSAPGQDGRTPGSITATSPRTYAAKRMKSRPSNLVCALILASPGRSYFVEHTYRHRTERGVPNMGWLRTPSGEELDKCDDDATKRCMMFRHSTVLPCLHTRHDEEGTCEAFVRRDTCSCHADVIFNTIYHETRHKGFGVFGYGGYKQRGDGNIEWQGSKGFYIKQSWWEDMAVVLENSLLADG